MALKIIGVLLIIFGAGFSSLIAAPCPTDGKTIGLKINHNKSGGCDIYLQNGNDGPQIFFRHLSNPTPENRQRAYSNGSVFVIEQTVTDRQHWVDRLFRYDPGSPGKLLFSGKGLGFSITPNADFIEITCWANDASDTNGRKLILLDKNGNTLQIYRSNELAKISQIPIQNFGDNLDVWGCTQNACWFASDFEEDIGSQVEFFRLDLKSMKLTSFPVKANYDDDGAFEPERGRFVFSNYPFFEDEDEDIKFASESHVIRLQLYDIERETVSNLMTSNSRRFNPKWVSPNMVQINNPSGTGRICLKVP